MQGLMKGVSNILNKLAVETPQKSSTNLKDLLLFMEFCESKAFAGPQKSQDRFLKFRELLHDLNRCNVSGSAVLYSRIGLDDVANDIDIFITDTRENKDTLIQFFNDKYFNEIFSDYFNKTNKSKSNLLSNTKYESINVNSDYAFIKQDCMLDTARFSQRNDDQGFNLNFIYVKRLKDEQRRIANVTERLTSSLFDQIFITSEGDIYFPSINSFSDDMDDDEMKILLDLYPKSIPTHMIHDSFDFQELKYVYNFQQQQIVSTFMVGKSLLEKFIHDIEVKISEEKIDIDNGKSYISDINKVIITLEAKNKVFIRLTEDSKVLTVSEKLLTQRAKNALNFFNPSSLEGAALEGFLEVSSPNVQRIIRDVYTAYHIVYSRVLKYEGNGFIINDPENMIADMQLFINNHTMFLLQNTSINNIALRAGLMSGTRQATKQIQALRKTYKAFEDLSKETSIKIMLPRNEKGEIDDVIEIEPQINTL